MVCVPIRQALSERPYSTRDYSETAWKTVRKKANVTGRWHDHRHTLITQLAENGAGEETIRQIVGHVSKEVLRDYLHVHMKAKRKALESIVGFPRCPSGRCRRA